MAKVYNKRSWQPRELRLVAEYLASRYTKENCYTRVRLGSTHPELELKALTEQERRMVGVWRRWADAVVITAKKVILIEAAIMPQPGDISLLKLYEYLFRFTPEFEDHKNKPLEKQLVYAIEDPLLLHLAAQEKIVVVKFRPDWIDDYLQVMYQREKRAPLTYPVPGK